MKLKMSENYAYYEVLNKWKHAPALAKFRMFNQTAEHDVEAVFSGFIVLDKNRKKFEDFVPSKSSRHGIQPSSKLSNFLTQCKSETAKKHGVAKTDILVTYNGSKFIKNEYLETYYSVIRQKLDIK